MSDDPKSFQSEAQRLAEAARERAAGAFEEIKLNSNQLVDKVRELIEEGNVRRIAIKKGDRTIFEIPLTVGAGAAAAAVLFNPLLAGIGAVAALISEVTLVVHREGGEEVPLKDVAKDVFDDAREAVKSAAAKATGAAKDAADDLADTADDAVDAAKDAAGDVADKAREVADAASDAAANAAAEAKKTVGRPPAEGDAA